MRTLLLVFPLAAGCAGDRLQIVENTAHVCFDVARHDLLGLRVERDLPRQVNRIAGADRLGVGADRLQLLRAAHIE